ncbi:FHIPEP family type III secretion protein [Sphingomonas sp. MMS24-JH45]
MILDRIDTMRRAQERRLGIGFPPVRIGDGAALEPRQYEIRLLGSRFGLAGVDPDRLLAIGAPGKPPAIEGPTTTDPAYGLPAVWIAPERQEEARGAGLRVVDPISAMATHLGEIAASEAAMLVTRPVAVRLIEEVRGRQPGLVEELVPAILTVADVQRIFQNLIGEGVSIANPDLILEHLADLARTHRDPADLTEQVRQRIAHAICHQLRGDHPDLAVLSLDPRIENQIVAGLGAGALNGAFPIEPGLAERLVRAAVRDGGRDAARRARAGAAVRGGPAPPPARLHAPQHSRARHLVGERGAAARYPTILRHRPPGGLNDLDTPGRAARQEARERLALLASYPSTTIPPTKRSASTPPQPRSTPGRPSAPPRSCRSRSRSTRRARASSPGSPRCAPGAGGCRRRLRRAGGGRRNRSRRPLQPRLARTAEGCGRRARPADARGHRPSRRRGDAGGPIAPPAGGARRGDGTGRHAPPDALPRPPRPRRRPVGAGDRCRTARPRRRLCRARRRHPDALTTRATLALDAEDAGAARTLFNASSRTTRTMRARMSAAGSRG